MEYTSTKFPKEPDIADFENVSGLARKYHVGNCINFWPSICLMLPGKIWRFHRKVGHFLAYFLFRPSFVFVFFSHSNWHTSKTWFLNASTAFYEDRNCWARIFSWCAGIKRSHWRPIQSSSSSSNFSEEFRQTNWGEPLKINRPTMHKWTVATWPVLWKQHTTICFEVKFL